MGEETSINNLKIYKWRTNCDKNREKLPELLSGNRIIPYLCGNVQSANHIKAT